MIADLLLGVASGIMCARSLQKAMGGGSVDGFGRAVAGDQFGRGAPARRGYLSRPMRARVYQVNSISERIKYMRSMIIKGRTNPEVRAAAAKVLSRRCGRTWCVAERDWDGEVAALFASMRRGVRYTRDPYAVDLFQHPLRTLQFAVADCDDYVITLGAMLQSVGYPVRMRVVRTKKARDWDHVYLLVGMPPRGPTHWLPLDASVPNVPPGWEAPKNMIAAKRDFAVE